MGLVLRAPSIAAAIAAATAWTAREFNATFHMNCQFAVRPVLDRLPHFKLRPPKFGGTEERVDW